MKVTENKGKQLSKLERITVHFILARLFMEPYWVVTGKAPATRHIACTA